MKTPVLSSITPNTSTSSGLPVAVENNAVTLNSSPAAEISFTSTSPSTKQTPVVLSSATQATSSSFSAAKSNSTLPSSSTNRTTSSSIATNQAATTTGAQNGSSVAQPELNGTSNTSESNGAQRIRRNAATSPVTPVKSEVKSLPLNREITNVSVSKYSGNVSFG